MMDNEVVFLPVDRVHMKDLFDWAVEIDRCKTTNVVLSPVSSPKKNGIKIAKSKANIGCLTRSNERDIALFRHKDKVFAVKASCPHAGGPLYLGDIEDLGGDQLCVKCPWHGWKIDLHTGHVLEPQGHDQQSTTVYPVKVTQNGKLYIGFDGIDPKYFRIEEIDF